MFQKERKIEESEFRHEYGQPWEEAGYFMALRVRIGI